MCLKCELFLVIPLEWAIEFIAQLYFNTCIAVIACVAEAQLQYLTGQAKDSFQRRIGSRMDFRYCGIRDDTRFGSDNTDTYNGVNLRDMFYLQ